MVNSSLTIVNEKGLHARASAKFVAVVEAYSAEATVSKDDMSASGDSIMGLLMLAASKGSIIKIKTTGSDAQALSDALTQLIEDKFGEES